MAQEIEEDKSWLSSTADFFKNLDYKQLAEESIPIVGENIIIGDIKENLKEGSLGSAALNTGALALGLFPLLGDIAAKPLRAAAKQLRKKDIGEAKKLIDDDVASEVWKEKNRLPESQRQRRIPEVQEAAEQLSEGKITSKEYRRTVKTNQPIELITKENFPTMPTKTEIVGALKGTDPRKVKTGIVGLNKTIDNGTRVASRLDIPAYDNYDKWIVSLHDGTKRGGEAIGYGQTAVLKNVEFVSSAKGGLNIAKGKSKATIARIHGDYYNAEPENVYEAVKDLLDSSEWIQVGMNPFRHSYFYNKATGFPVTRADEVLQVGPLVLARGVKTPTISDLKQLKIKTSDGKIRAFNEGGPVMALEEQTEMAFRDKPPEVDPVSGNEVPPGALPEEVRDDIPARLSEGEYVVPADVLQYYGIKFFEDLRGKAKMELASMEENGRMGGEPVDDASMEGMDDLPFSAEELNTYDDGQDAPVREFDEGGPVTEMASLNPSTFIKTYINEAGNKLYIRFVNGVAIPPVPPGYTEEGAIVDADPVDPVVDAEQRRLEAEANRNPEQDQSITDGSKPTNRQTVGELLWTIQRSVYKDAFPDSLSAKVFESGSKAFPMLSGLAGSMKGPTTLEGAVAEAKARLARGKDYQGVVLNDEEKSGLNFIINLETKKLDGATIYKNINAVYDIHLGFTDDAYIRNIRVPNLRTGTGRQTYEGDYETFLDPSTATATSKFYKNKLDADAARIEMTKDYRGRTPNVVTERFASIRAGEGSNRSAKENEKTIEKIKKNISKRNIKEARIELDDREDSIYIDGVKKEPVNIRETTAKEIAQKVGKGYTGGVGFNKGGLASRKKKKK